MGFLTSAAGAIGGVGLGDAIVAVAVDTGPLETGLQKARAEVEASTSAMSASAKAISTGFVIAGAAAALAIGKAISATQELALDTRDLQRVTGLSAESASGLLFVTEGLGISTGALQSSFKTLAVNIAKGSDVFARYGIETTNADGSTKDLTDILGQASDKFVELGGGMKGTALATAIFGRAGKELIGVLEQGSVSLDQAIAAADQYGVVLGQDTVDDVVALVNAHADLDSAIQGLQVSIGTDLVPVLTMFIHGITELVVAFNAIPGPIKTVALVLTAATGALFLFQKAVAFTTAAWGPLIAAMGLGAAEQEVVAAGAVQLSFALETEAVAAEAAGVGFTAMLGPIGLFVAALSAAYLASQHLSGAISEAIDPAVQLAEAAQLAAEKHIPFAQALQEVKDKEAEAAAAADGLSTADQILADEADKAAAAQKRLATATQALTPDTVSLADATKQLAQDRRALDKAQEHGNTTGARYNALVLQTAQDTEAWRQSVRAVSRDVQASGKTNEEAAAKLIKMAGGFDNVSGSAQRFIEKLFGIKHGIDALHDKTVTVTFIERHLTDKLQ